MYTIQVIDATGVITVPCDKAYSISVGGSSDTAGAQLDYDIVFVDVAGNIVGTLAPVTLVCGTAKDWPLTTPPTVYRGRPQLDNEPAVHVAGVVAFVDVMALRPATAKWTLSAHATYPPGVTVAS